jgi:hypothetical protein
MIGSDPASDMPIIDEQKHRDNLAMSFVLSPERRPPRKRLVGTRHSCWREAATTARQAGGEPEGGAGTAFEFGEPEADPALRFSS